MMEMLHHYIDKNQTFSWGKNDCALFAANWVVAATGYDLMEEFRGRYSTELGSLRVLKRYGEGDLISSCAKKMEEFKFEECLPSYSPRGAVGAFDGCLGIVVDHRAVFLNQQRITLVPVSRLNRVWRII